VITAVGIPNVLTKVDRVATIRQRSKATIDALEQLRDKGEMAEMRG